MGDWLAYMYNPDFSIVKYSAIYVKNWGLSGLIRADELLSEYGIKIISFEPSAPIV